MDPLKFQQLCCEIHQREPDISTAYVFGQNGQPQYGVDVIANLRSNDGVEVGQCKRVSVAHCNPSLIRSVSDDFIRHLAYWKGYGVRKFVLYIGCSVSKRQVLEEIAEQRKRFLGLGLVYQVWSDLTLTSKLRPSREIVRAYFSVYWERELCGEGISNFPVAAGTVVDIAAYAELADSLADRLSRDADEELERLREAWREGRPSEMSAGIRKLRELTRWRVLPQGVRAKVVRFQAQLALEAGDLGSAESLTSEARELDPVQTRRTEALLDRAHGRLDDALARLQTAEDADSQVLLAALLLEKGRAPAARLILEKHQGSAEAHRLLALAFFLQGDVPRARLEAEKAVALKPRWRAVVYARCVINYFAALSPCALPVGLPQWPEPSEWGLVRVDDASRTLLRSAADGFGELATASELEAGERRLYQVWHLACLSNDPERRDEAESYCKNVLNADAHHYLVVPWVLARRLQVDLEQPVALLKARESRNEATIPEIVTLAVWLAQDQDAPAAVGLLDRSRTLFESSGAAPLWRLWRTQLAVLAGIAAQSEEAEKVGEDPANDLDEARLAGLRASALKTGDSTALIETLRKYPPGDGTRLFELCGALAERERWAEAAELAPTLLEKVSTADALSLVCICLYNTKEHARCLSLLDQHRSFYPHSELPSEMQRLRIAAQRELGMLPEATVQAAELFRREPSKRNFLILGDLYFEKADFKALAVLFRRHTAYSALTTKELLRMSMRVLDEDRAIGAELWRSASRIGFEDDEVTAAIEVGFKLGLGTELRPLLERLHRLADKSSGDVRRFTVRQALEAVREHADEADRLYRTYQEGRVPIHMITGPARWPLVLPYHRLPQTNQVSGRGTAALIRHGSRIAPRVQADDATHLQLHADVTALLTASQLGLLESIEDAFRPISLPHRTLVALVALRDAVKSPQPSRLAPLTAVADFVQQNKITVFDKQPEPMDSDGQVSEVDAHTARLLDAARGNGWKLATSLPVLSKEGQPVNEPLPAEWDVILRDGHSIIDSLLGLGEITEYERQRALEAMGLRHALPTHQRIEIGATILCRTYILEFLADAGLLARAATAFHLIVDKYEFSRSVVAGIESLTGAAGDVAWLTKLISHVSKGLEDGLYRLMPELGNRRDAVSGAADQDPILKCFLDLLTFVPSPGDVVWADDRWLGGYVHRDGALVVDTIDLLYALSQKGTISVAKRLDTVRRARESGFRFIALDESEIKAAVAEAGVIDDRLVETRTLRILRSYYAQCLADGETLSVVPSTERIGNNSLEWPFILGSGQAVINSVVGLWQEGKDDLDAARARSEWVLSNLYVPDRGRSLTLAKASADLDLQIEAVSLSALLGRATVFSPTDPTERRARRAYFEWIYFRLIQHRFVADPLLATLVLDGLKRLLVLALEATDTSPLQRGAAKAVAAAFFSDLPEQLNQELAQDGDFMARVGARQRATLRLGSDTVSATALWNAAANLVTEGTSQTVKTDAGTELELHVENGETLRLLALEKQSNTLYVLLPRAVDIFAGSATARERALRSVRAWFDCCSADFEQAVAKVALIDDPANRMEEFIRLRREGAESYYADLHETVRQGQQFRASDLTPPDATSLLRHLRLPRDFESGDSFGTAIECAAETLIVEAGVETAAMRFAGLPVSLPTCILRSLEALSVDVRGEIVKRFVRSVSVSPLGAAHGARLLMAFSSDRRSYYRLARRLIRRNFQCRDHVETWLAVLQRCSEDLCFTEPFREMSAVKKSVIVWAHGDRLFRVFCNLGLPLDWIRENIGQPGTRLPAEVVFADSQYTSDVAYPRRVDASIFGLASAAYVVKHADSGPLRQCVSDLIDGNQAILVRLVRDQTRVPNVLGSFLAPVPLWYELLPESTREHFSPAATRGALAEVLDQLQSGTSDPALWAWIHAALGDLQPPPEFVDPLTRAILSTDFVGMYESAQDHRLVPITVATMEAAHLGSQVRSYVRSQLVTLASRLRDTSSTGGIEGTDQQPVLSAAFNVAAAIETPAQKFSELALLVETLVATWPPLREESARLVNHLIHGLPAKESRHFWPLQTRLRALG